jgi:hypothetical protein
VSWKYDVDFGPGVHLAIEADVFESVCTLARRALPFQADHLENHKDMVTVN